MSTFRCDVIPITLEPHPNAESLSIVRYKDYPVVVRTDEWAHKDKGVYIPIDAIVPDTEEFAFLEGHRRIKARRLRGVFSMGLLTHARPGMEVGDDVTEALGVVKYEPPIDLKGAEFAPDPPRFTCEYTDIENLRRFPNMFEPGEHVVVTEKIDGTNTRHTWRDGVLHVGSHHRWVKSGMWHKPVTPELLDFIQNGGVPKDAIVFGEVYGAIQNLHYGLQNKLEFRIFDVFDVHTQKYLDFPDLANVASEAQFHYGILGVPVLYVGPFDIDIVKTLAEENSALCPNHIREGVVIRPVKERYDDAGRVIAKYHSEKYLLKNYNL